MTGLGGLTATVQSLQDAVRSMASLFDLGALLQRAWDNSNVPLATTFSRLVLVTGDPFSAAPNGSGAGFTSLDVIKNYNRLCAVIASAALTFLLMWGFFRLQWTRAVRPQYSVRAMLPRVGVAAALIGFSLTLVQAMVDLNNALCKVVLESGWSFDLNSLMDPARDFYTGPGLAVLATAALLIALLVLALAYFVRFALLAVLAVTAPLAAVLFILPETQKYAREWMGLFVTTLFMQPLQLLILIIGFHLETAATGNLLRHGFVLAAIIVAFKVPGALHTASSFGTQATTAAKRDVSHLVKAVIR
ncbi:MAG TPA: conjugal transfer protein TrbL family protein [Candidatus Dormibacteraeota bacterium]|jgi:hypothetical protein|nr:conjugal transfer protein TrbL family protein [Candidatus Dormibacteraeota bacterium]